MTALPRAEQAGGRTARWHWVIGALAASNAALLAWALVDGSRVIEDPAVGDVTSGRLVALGLAATLAAAYALRWLPLPGQVIVQARAIGLGAQALHATGHLANLYHIIWWYDDLLHVGLVLLTTLILLAWMRRAPDLAPRLSSRPALLLVGISIATAIGGAWEVFEYVSDVASGTREQDNLADTMQDMIDGMIGGLLAALLTGARDRLWKRPATSVPRENRDA